MNDFGTSARAPSFPASQLPSPVPIRDPASSYIFARVGVHSTARWVPVPRNHLSVLRTITGHGPLRYANVVCVTCGDNRNAVNVMHHGGSCRLGMTAWDRYFPFDAGVRFAIDGSWGTMGMARLLKELRIAFY